MKKLLCVVLIILQFTAFSLPSLAQTDTMKIYCFEWSFEDNEEENEQIDVLKNTENVIAFLSKLEEKGWQNQQLTAFLEEIAPTFFEENLVVAVYDFGMHGGTNDKRVVTNITIDKQSAAVYYAPADKRRMGKYQM